MWLLSYDWQHPNCSESGPGWDWDEKLETFDDENLLEETLRGLQEEIVKERSRWEKSDPKWRGPNFIPPYRRIQTYDLIPVTLEVA